MRKIIQTFLILSLFIFLQCGKKSGDKASGGQSMIQIVATTGMIADVAKNVGGELVSVQALMGPGVDPHLYKASEGDVSRMAKAKIILYNGLHLEGKMTEVFEKLGRRVKTVPVAEAIDSEKLLAPPEFKGAHDPHVWFDVSLWEVVVRRIRDVLVAFDAPNADIYKANAQKYLVEMERLDAYVKEQSAKVPAEKRVLITAHDAFNYFGRAYGFEVKGLQGISTASEAGTADVQNLATFIVERKIPAVFVETSVPPRYIEALQAAVRSRNYDVKIGGSLFSDAMGSPTMPEGKYLGMVKHNIDTIVNALIN